MIFENNHSYNYSLFLYKNIFKIIKLNSSYEYLDRWKAIGDHKHRYYKLSKRKRISMGKNMPSSTFYVAIPKKIDVTSDDWKTTNNIKFILYTNKILVKLPNLIWLNVIMTQLCKRFDINIYFSALPCIPFFIPSKVKAIIVVHDVVNIEFKKTMQWTNKIANKLFLADQ